MIRWYLTCVTNIQCIFFYGGMVILCTSCFPPVEENLTELTYELSDPVVQQIINAQDSRNTDSLVLYLKHKKSNYRLLAYKAFASNRDTSAILQIAEGLKDPEEQIKQAAAFALGQIGHSSAETPLIAAFIAVDSVGPFTKTNAIILEALGKCGSDSTLQYLCDITSYQPEDTDLVYGQMISLYRFGLRDKFCSQSIEKWINVATTITYNYSSRLIAAHCLQRFKNLDLNSHFESMKQATINEKNIAIRMCLISAFARIKNPNTLPHLEEMYTRGLDPRIQSNLIRGLINHSGPAADKLAIRAIQNPSIQIAIPAAQYLVEKGGVEFIENTKDLIDLTLSWPIKSLLFEGALKHTPAYMVLTHESLRFRLKQQIASAKSDYEKAAYIKAMAGDPKQLTTLLNYYSKNASPIVKTTIAETVEKMVTRPDFISYYKTAKNPIYAKLTQYFNSQCETLDQGSLSVMASIFKKSNSILNAYFNPDSALSVAQSKLKLPRDIEVYNELGDCISKLNGHKFIPKKVAFNHPIDWEKMTKLKDTIYCTLVTDKGNLNMELYTKEAPATVLNFVTLVQDGFFTNKVFHRMVPNFVIQSGCPRGDGYGSLDYTIRTEIGNLNYAEEASVGMASAGFDTECSQFFITHSPTPHLDGKYTLFGRMTSGIDVLLIIQQGDNIQEIKIEEH